MEGAIAVASSGIGGLHYHSKKLLSPLSSVSNAFRTCAVKAVHSQIQEEAATKKQLRQRRPQNAQGDLFVDHTCIDCGTCRWMAPQIFTLVDGMSAVSKQPSCKEEGLNALQALISCPTASIHTEKPSSDILEAHKTFPIPIDEHRLPGVFHCGYHSEKSYGATSYLIVHPEGNILVDSPRYTVGLAHKIERLGGARYMFLTHEDDVADHKMWSNKLGCDRILHSGDVSPFLVEDSTADVEMKLEGSGPWRLYQDIVLVHTPGHTKGSVCLFYESLEILFTGDHIGMSEFGLSMFERYNKCSVAMQLESIRMLLDLDFKWIMPGHGIRAEFEDLREKNSNLEAMVKKYCQLYSL